MQQSTKDLHPCLIFYFCSHLRCLFSRLSIQFSAVQLRLTLWPHGLQHTRLPCPSPTQHDLAETLAHRVSDAIQPSLLCHSLLLLPSVFPSIRVFSKESVLHIRWPRYWSFSFSISPSNVLIFFRVDWFDILAVQGTLKSLLQYHSLKASILQCSAFLMVQISHPYMTTG